MKGQLRGFVLVILVCIAKGIVTYHDVQNLKDVLDIIKHHYIPSMTVNVFSRPRDSCDDDPDLDCVCKKIEEPTTTTTCTMPETTTTGYCDTFRTAICPDGSRCHSNATCTLGFSGSYTCKCIIGYAGDGADCGLDSDLDSWPDVELTCCEVQNHCSADNCPSTPNSGQEDSDFDGVGDACDKIINTFTPPSTILTTTLPDNTTCKLYSRNYVCTNTSIDSDGDGYGDECDNCPDVSNVDQTDSDHELVGDACDTDQDTDNDGYQDGIDNCIDVVNPEQNDADQDGLGDKCDDDADDDGIPNDSDNCLLVPNPGQLDANNNGLGDICEEDFDGDCVTDNTGDDVCPFNSMISSTDFRQFFRVNLDGNDLSNNVADWVILDGGKEITETRNSNPGLLYGQDCFSGVNYDGTLHIGNVGDDDYAGFIFGYQSSKKFYVIMWKKDNQNGPGGALGQRGLQLKKVQSITGPSVELATGLWLTGDTADQVTLLWHDPNRVQWLHGTSYRWQLIHRPVIGLIRARFLAGSSVIVDTGNIFDDDINGGRLGVYCDSQRGIIWSNLDYSCNDDSVPQEVYDDLPADKKSKIKVDPFKSWSGTV